MTHLLPFFRLVLISFFCITTIGVASAQHHASSFGFEPNNPTKDASVAWGLMLQSTGTDKTVYFPSGVYYFKTKPNQVQNALNIIGDQATTQFHREYQPANLHDALIHSTKTMNIQNIVIYAASGTVGGGGIWLEGGGTSNSVIRDVIINADANANWEVPLNLSSSTPTGIRTCLIENVELFAATVHLAWFQNVQGLTANLNVYSAGGSVNHITIQGAGAYSSGEISLSSRHLEKLYIYDTHSLQYTGLTPSIIIDANSSLIHHVTGVLLQ